MTDVDVLDPVMAPNPQHLCLLSEKILSGTPIPLWDSNQVYGLKLPRHIESTQHTRKQRMADRKISGFLRFYQIDPVSFGRAGKKGGNEPLGAGRA